MAGKSEQEGVAVLETNYRECWEVFCQHLEKELASILTKMNSLEGDLLVTPSEVTEDIYNQKEESPMVKKYFEDFPFPKEYSNGQEIKDLEPLVTSLGITEGVTDGMKQLTIEATHPTEQLSQLESYCEILATAWQEMFDFVNKRKDPFDHHQTVLDMMLALDSALGLNLLTDDLEKVWMEDTEDTEEVAKNTEEVAEDTEDTEGECKCQEEN